MEGIIDYAGLFPPADLSLDTALQKYSEYRKSGDAWMLSRFIIPGLRLNDLERYGETLFTEGKPFAFSVLGKGTETISDYREHLEELVEEMRQFHRLHEDRVTTDILEIKLPREAVFANDREMLHELYQYSVDMLQSAPRLPGKVFFEGYFESNWKKEIGLILDTMSAFNSRPDAAGDRETGFKIRCGGLEPESFPSIEQLAFALHTSREQNIALKATAGLHHPIRHYAEEVQTRMHGFFNVFGGAMLGYAHDLNNEQMQEILKEEDPDHFFFTEETFGWREMEISKHEIAELREVALTSFGSCSFDEPREDLRRLKLLNTE